MKTFNIKFEGFYESIHSGEIDSQLESYFVNEDGTEQVELPDNINYQLLHSEYVKLYVQAFTQVLNAELSLEIALAFKELVSPREYNFITDSINTNIDNDDFNKLKVKLLIDPEFVNYVNEESQSCSGFASFYEGIDAVAADDEILLIYIGKFLIELYADDINDCLQNEFYSYELVGSVDFLRVA